MKVYGSGGFQNAGSSVNGTSERADFVVGTSSGSYTGSTTTFPATYDAGFVDVYLKRCETSNHQILPPHQDQLSILVQQRQLAIQWLSFLTELSNYLATITKTQVDAFIDDVETLALAGI